MNICKVKELHLTQSIIKMGVNAYVENVQDVKYYHKFLATIK